MLANLDESAGVHTKCARQDDLLLLFLEKAKSCSNCTRFQWKRFPMKFGQWRFSSEKSSFLTEAPKPKHLNWSIQTEALWWSLLVERISNCIFQYPIQLKIYSDQCIFGLPFQFLSNGFEVQSWKSFSSRRFHWWCLTMIYGCLRDWTFSLKIFSLAVMFAGNFRKHFNTFILRRVSSKEEFRHLRDLSIKIPALQQSLDGLVDSIVRTLCRIWRWYWNGDIETLHMSLKLSVR